jgi:ABC-type multidrug transport system fused ATPase/permease subunit
VEPKTAFRRAWEILDHHPTSKWTAQVAAVLAGLTTVALLVVLALFVDLLVSHGRVPNYQRLGEEQKRAFAAGLPDLSSADRAEGLRQTGAPAGQPDGPVQDFDALNATAREQLWRAYVWHMISHGVSDDAAAEYAKRTKDTKATPEYDVPGMGILSLFVRSQAHWFHPVVGGLASWNRWTWQPDDARAPNFRYLTGLLIIGIILALARAVLLNVMNYSAESAALAVATWLRRAVYHHTYRLGALAIRPSGTTEAVGLFGRHVESIQDAVIARLTSLFYGPVQLALLLAFALAVHFWLAVAFLLAAMIVFLVGGQVAVNFRRTARSADRRAAVHMSLLQESLAMMRLVKSNVMELFNQSRVERQLAEYAAARRRRFQATAMMGPLLWFLGFVSAAVLLYAAGAIVLTAGQGTANVIVLAATLVAGYWPVREWLTHRRLLARGKESAALVYEFLDRPREVGQVVGAEFLPGIRKGVEFRDVSLRDPTTGRMLLEGVNLRIGAGERVGLVGNEDEKHAVVYLLTRFLDPAAGEVRIDDKNLRWLTLDSIRAQVGVVLQQNLTFNDTVANNIGCGDPAFAIPQIIEAAKIAHAHHFIQKLPYGYETPIGELGSSLKPGEQFRIALARAILRDPAMYVIEEPPAAFDEETKAMLDDAFSRILAGRTVLFLPHRISTIRSCDRIYVLHKGQLQAAGDHRELLAKNDLYRHLHYLEFNEFVGHTPAMT